MRKKILSKTLIILMLISVFTFALAGCRKVEVNNEFNDTFGASGISHTTKNLEKIVLTDDTGAQGDTIFTALGKINANYRKYNYVGVRGLVKGTTTGTTSTTQSIYITNIQEKDVMTNKVKIYHEDASVSSLKMIAPTIVQIMQQVESNGKTNVKVREASGTKGVITNKEAYPTVKQYNEKEPKVYKDMTTYLNDYHQDVSQFLPYLLDATTLDEIASTITQDAEGFINLHLVVKQDSLQAATAEKRETIAIKTNYSPITITADKVKYSKLVVDIKLWPDNYVRSVTTYEKYVMDSGSTLGIQTCDLTSNLYYSYDPLELPIKEFEF